MEKTIIDQSILLSMFQEDEFACAELLRDALKEVHRLCGNINNNTIIKHREQEDAQYQITISLTTVKTYAEKFGYTIENKPGDLCVTKQFTVEEYKSIKARLDGSVEMKKTTGTTSTMTAAHKIGLEFEELSQRYGEMKLLSLRCSKYVLEDFNSFCSKHKYFDKAFLLSYMLSNGLSMTSEGK